MNYLFFDVECISCKGGKGKLFSFGYVLTNDNFEIIEKEDILMNPKLPRSEYDWYVVKHMMSYTLNEIENAPCFTEHYYRIKDLLQNPNNIVLGFDVYNDLMYVNDECERFNLPKIERKACDVQDLYKQYSGEHRQKGLSKLVELFEIDKSPYIEHNSCDDAEMTMLVAKAICEKLNLAIDDIINICDSSFVEAKERRQKTEEEKKQIAFNIKLKKIAVNYPNRDKWPSICFSDSIKEVNAEGRLRLIKAIFDKQYNYTSKVSECSIFVIGNEYGERDLSCDHNIENNNKDIKKISIEELSELLAENVDEHGEIEEKVDFDSPFMIALLKSLEKKGITYEDYIKNLNK